MEKARTLAAGEFKLLEHSIFAFEHSRSSGSSGGVGLVKAGA